MDTHAMLSEAISSRQQVIAHYDGEERHFSPHALGTKQGKRHVLVFQYAGGSRGGLPEGGEWRCLDDIEVLADPLPPRTATRQ